MKHLKKLSCVLLIFILCVFAVPVYAGGVPAGSGDGPSVPLYMRDCSLSDGQKDVSTDVMITLYYSHNVADAAVQANNRSAISMTDSNGKSVSLTVSYSSVFEYRQEIYVKPSGLQGGTTYTLKVGPSLMARNGYTTGTTDTITFTTKAGDSSGGGNNQSTDSDAGSSTGTAGSGNSSAGSGNSSAGSGNSSAGSSSNSSSSGTGSSGNQNTGSSGTTSQAPSNAGTSDSKTTGNTSDGSDTADEAEAIEAEKMQEALDSGLVEETTEKEIVKVSDKKPGRVETEEVIDSDTDQEKTSGTVKPQIIIVCVVVAAAAVTVGLRYRRAKQDGKKV